MQLQQLEKSATQSLPPGLLGKTTLESQINTAVAAHHLNQEGGKILLDLQSKQNNLSPEDVERHALIAKSVLELSSGVGRPRLH